MSLPEPKGDEAERHDGPARAHDAASDDAAVDDAVPSADAGAPTSGLDATNDDGTGVASSTALVPVASSAADVLPGAVDDHDAAVGGRDGGGTHDAGPPGDPPLLPPAPDRLLPLGPKRRSGLPRIAAAVGLFCLVVSLPLWVGQSGAAFLVDLAVLVALAQWWGLLAGFAGRPSLAGAFYAGTGTYVWTASVQWAGLNPVVAVLVAAIAVAAVALLTGWVLLRLAPAWTALAGLVLMAAAFQLITVIDEPSVAGRQVSAVVALSSTLRRSLSTWLAVVLGVGSVAAVVALRRSRLGLAVVAHRDDPEAASTLGVRSTWATTVIWILAAVAAGTAGAVLHFRTGSVAVGEAFDPLFWVVPPLVAAALGGMRSLSGPVLGAFVYLILNRLFGAPTALALCAIAAAVLMVVVPRGLAEHAEPVVAARLAPLRAKLRPVSSPTESNTATTARP